MYKGKIPEDLNKGSVWALYLAEVIIDRRGFYGVISEKLRAYNLAGEFINFLRALIANQKYKLAVVALSAKWG